MKFMKMKKSVRLLVLCLLVLLLVPLSALFSGAEGDYFTDGANTLGGYEAGEIETRLRSISSLYGITVRIYTERVDLFEDDDFDEDAALRSEEIARENTDSVVLYLQFRIDGNTYRVAYNGDGRKLVKKRAPYSFLEDQFLSALQAHDYSEAYSGFIEGCDYLLGYEMDNGRTYRASFAFGKNLLIGLVIGFIVALIVTSVMKGRLKSVKMQTSADFYVRDNSLIVTKSQDLFLYQTTVRTAKPKSSSSGGSGGGFHSGGGGSGSRGGRF